MKQFFFRYTKAVAFFSINIFCCAFKLNAQKPTISSFAPSSGCVGSLITIYGSNFDSTTTVKIGNVKQVVVTNYVDSVVALVMPSTNSGLLSVTTASGVTNTSSTFSVVKNTYGYPQVQKGDKITETNLLYPHPTFPPPPIR